MGAASVKRLDPAPEGRLRDRTVVITGAGRGLGKGVALAMAMEGADLWICDKTSEELEQTQAMASAFDGAVHHRRVDLESTSGCEAFAREVRDACRSVDCLVNNAGILPRTAFAEVSLEEWEATLAVNLTACFILSQKLLGGMAASGGSFINVSSRAGVLGFANQTSYCASKFALEGLTRALAKEVPENISANTVTPGMKIKPTNLTEAEESALPKAQRAWSDPIRIAPAFIYLALARGRPSGRRFVAERLTECIHKHGYEMGPEIAESIAE